MARLGDYFGDGGAETTNPPKGSMEWAEQQGGGNDTPQMKDPLPPKGTQQRVEQDATQVNQTPPAKGTQEWAEQNSGENASETTPTPQQQPQATDSNTPSDSTPEDGGELNYADMWKKLNPYEPPTPEQLEKERKKKKRDQIWAAVGDGIAALSNLFFTSQYAPNAYTGRNTMSEAVQDRWDKLDKDRKDNAINYFNSYLRAKMADDANDRDKRNWEYRIGRDKAADGLAAAKAKRDDAMHQLNLQLAGHKIDAAEADAKRKKIAAEFAEAQEQAKVDTEKARGVAQRASASASNARAGYYSRGGNGGNKKMTLTIKGKTYTYDSKEDYERAVMRYAKEYNIPTDENYELTEEDINVLGTSMGTKKKTSKRGRDVSKIAGDVETAANRKEKQTGLGIGNGKNKTNGKKSGLGL